MKLTFAWATDLSRTKREATNELKRLLVGLPHWLKTARGAFQLRRVRTAQHSSYKQTMKIYNT